MVLVVYLDADYKPNYCQMEFRELCSAFYGNTLMKKYSRIHDFLEFFICLFF